jgi:hypothetical protein
LIAVPPHERCRLAQKWLEAAKLRGGTIIGLGPCQARAAIFIRGS